MNIDIEPGIAAYIFEGERHARSHETRELVAGIVFGDYDETGRLVGVEVLLSEGAEDEQGEA